MIDEELRQRWEEEAGQYPALVADVFNGALKEANRVVGKSTKAEVKKFIINTVTEAIQAPEPALVDELLAGGPSGIASSFK